MASLSAQESKEPETKDSTTTKTTTTTTAPIPTIKCPHLGQENDEGNVEYKLKLISVEPERLQHLTTQLNFRLAEGGNEATYMLGVADNGTPTGISPTEMEETLQTLAQMCASLTGTKYKVLRIREGQEKGSQCAEVLVRQLSQQNDEKKEVRVAVIGNVDSGKSTLIGVLTKGSLDNGRGSARSNVFRHRHEIETGRTSSVSQQILGFSTIGEFDFLSFSCVTVLRPRTITNKVYYPHHTSPFFVAPQSNDPPTQQVKSPTTKVCDLPRTKKS